MECERKNVDWDNYSTYDSVLGNTYCVSYTLHMELDFRDKSYLMG